MVGLFMVGSLHWGLLSLLTGRCPVGSREQRLGRGFYLGGDLLQPQLQVSRLLWCRLRFVVISPLWG
jgi:hypothetical protein